MIYTKVNLREFVECVNELAFANDIEFKLGNSVYHEVKVEERDPEIYRGYQWGVSFDGIRPISWGGEYGYPRDAARNLYTELNREFPEVYSLFWNCKKFRDLVRDIES